MAIKAILFDKDGTLIDFKCTYGPATAAVIRELASHDQSTIAAMAQAVDFDFDTLTFLPSSIIIAGTASDQAHAWNTVLKRAEINSLEAEIDTLFVRHATEFVSPFDFTIPVLDNLRTSGFHLGIGTNDSEAGAIQQAEKMNMSEYFPYIAGYDSGHGAKPGPGMVLAFAEYLNIAPAEVMMVGDSLHDMHCAKNAGALRVAVTSGLAGKDELNPHADHVLENIASIPQLLTELSVHHS